MRYPNIILVTAFDAFGGETLNSSAEVLRRLPSPIVGATIVKLQIPTMRAESLACIAQSIASCDPDVILCLGQAGGRRDLTVERVGLNVDDYGIPDNAGDWPVDEPIDAEGPAAYFVTLPIKAMVAAIRAAGLRARVSNSAGTYVCNHVCYGVSRLCAQEGGGRRSGFVHVPWITEQCADQPGRPCWTLDDATRGVSAAIEAIVSAGATTLPW